MTVEETAKKEEILCYVKSAIEYLEKAMNEVECDDNFNEGQSNAINKVYGKIADVYHILEKL